MAKRIEDLRAMSDEELSREYNSFAASTTDALNIVRDEIVRRESAAASAEVVRLTRALKNLTVGIVVMTGVIVLMTAVLVWVAIRGVGAASQVEPAGTSEVGTPPS